MFRFVTHFCCDRLLNIRIDKVKLLAKVSTDARIVSRPLLTSEAATITSKFHRIYYSGPKVSNFETFGTAVASSLVGGGIPASFTHRTPFRPSLDIVLGEQRREDDVGKAHHRTASKGAC